MGILLWIKQWAGLVLTIKLILCSGRMLSDMATGDNNLVELWIAAHFSRRGHLVIICNRPGSHILSFSKSIQSALEAQIGFFDPTADILPG